MQLVGQEDGVWLLVGLENTLNNRPEGTSYLFRLGAKVEDVVVDAPIDYAHSHQPQAR